MTSLLTAHVKHPSRFVFFPACAASNPGRVPSSWEWRETIRLLIFRRCIFSKRYSYLKMDYLLEVYLKF